MAYQSVHGPYEEPPAWEQIPADSSYTGDHAYGSMLNAMDKGLGNVYV